VPRPSGICGAGRAPAREVAFGLWYTGTARVNPVFRADLHEVQEDIGRSLDTLLRN